jgi:5,10-methylenetetrahydromethanopterin reductase
MEHYANCARAALKYNFDQIQVYDDLPFRPTWPIVFTIAEMIRKTKSRTSIGSGVVVPYLIHPALIASHLACLEEESGQRAFVVLGRGAFHDLYHTEVPHPMNALKESVNIIDSLLSGKRASFTGKVFSQSDEAQFRWKSTLKRRKHVPIYLGTWGPKTAEMAARMDNVAGIIVGAIVESNYIQKLRQSMDKGAKESSRKAPVDCGVCPSTVVSHNRSDALRKSRNAAAVYLTSWGNLTDYAGVPKSEVEEVRVAIANKDMKSARELVTEKTIDAFTMWGTPDDVIKRTQELARVGVTRINYALGWGPEDLDAIRILGKEVLPHFT